MINARIVDDLLVLWAFFTDRSFHLQRVIDERIRRYGHWFLPFVLIVLGAYILLKTGALALLRHF